MTIKLIKLHFTHDLAQGDSHYLVQNMQYIHSEQIEESLGQPKPVSDEFIEKVTPIISLFKRIL